METRYYSMKEAAEILGVSRTWMYYLKETRRIRVEKIGAQYVVSEAELHRYKQHKEPAEAQ